MALIQMNYYSACLKTPVDVTVLLPEVKKNTGDVGLPERMEMVGFPYHKRDVYVEKIRKKSEDSASREKLYQSVVCEGGDEGSYLENLGLSVAEEALAEYRRREKIVKTYFPDFKSSVIRKTSVKDISE